MGGSSAAWAGYKVDRAKAKDYVTINKLGSWEINMPPTFETMQKLLAHLEKKLDIQRERLTLVDHEGAKKSKEYYLCFYFHHETGWFQDCAELCTKKPHEKIYPIVQPLVQGDKVEYRSAGEVGSYSFDRDGNLRAE